MARRLGPTSAACAGPAHHTRMTCAESAHRLRTNYKHLWSVMFPALRVHHLSIGLLWSAPGLVALLLGCDDGPVAPTAAELIARFDLEAVGDIPYPPDNLPHPERVSLGRLLFFDPILGGEQDVACGTCHHPMFAFTDGRQFGAGVSGVGLGPGRQLSVSDVTGSPIPDEPRNTQTILNVAFAMDASGVPSHLAPLFWDGRATGLEAQALMPIASRAEMRGDAYPGTEEEAAVVAVDSVLNRLRAIPEYVSLFRGAFADEGADTVTVAVTASRLARALGAYQRELITVNTPYDRMLAGDDEALTPAQKRGLEVFFTGGKCSLCHRGAMFSNFLFRVTGTPQEGPGKSAIPGDDTGREEHTGQLQDRYAFRVPSLRNVELTPPYMHSGVFETLEEVVAFYNAGARPRNPNVTDTDIEVALQIPLDLTSDEVSDLVSFLRALTDPGTVLDPVLLQVPGAVPSGLVPVFGGSR